MVGVFLGLRYFVLYMAPGGGRLRQATAGYDYGLRGERGGERGGFEKNRRMVDREMMDQEKVDQGHCRMKVVMNGQGGSSEVG